MTRPNSGAVVQRKDTPQPVGKSRSGTRAVPPTATLKPTCVMVGRTDYWDLIVGLWAIGLLLWCILLRRNLADQYFGEQF